jgi:hypothetical protein
MIEIEYYLCHHQNEVGLCTCIILLHMMIEISDS